MRHLIQNNRVTNFGEFYHPYHNRDRIPSIIVVMMVSAAVIRPSSASPQRLIARHVFVFVWGLLVVMVDHHLVVASFTFVVVAGGCRQVVVVGGFVLGRRLFAFWRTNTFRVTIPHDASFVRTALWCFARVWIEMINYTKFDDYYFCRYFFRQTIILAISICI